MDGHLLPLLDLRTSTQPKKIANIALNSLQNNAQDLRIANYLSNPKKNCIYQSKV